jgi:pre-mRNA-processing factor SLU7
MNAHGDRMSAADFRKKKELDEARKNGTLPPEQDADGNLINPHNPDYISKRPWYLGQSGPSLTHQINPKKDHVLSMTEADQLSVKAFKAVPGVRKKFQKGACTNCGAMTHKANECVERPRKVGAWKTNKNIAADEVLVDVRSGRFGKLTFDAKRDAWLGYDASEHQDTIDRFEKMETLRNEKRIEKMNKEAKDSAKAKRIKSKGRGADDNDSDSDSDYDSDSDGEESENEEFRDKEGGRVISERVARQGGVGGAEMKTTVS